METESTLAVLNEYSTPVCTNNDCQSNMKEMAIHFTNVQSSKVKSKCDLSSGTEGNINFKHQKVKTADVANPKCEIENARDTEKVRAPMGSGTELNIRSR